MINWHAIHYVVRQNDKTCLYASTLMKCDQQQPFLLLLLMPHLSTLSASPDSRNIVKNSDWKAHNVLTNAPPSHAYLCVHDCCANTQLVHYIYEYKTIHHCLLFAHSSACNQAQQARVYNRILQCVRGKLCIAIHVNGVSITWIRFIAEARSPCSVEWFDVVYSQIGYPHGAVCPWIM